MLGKFYFILYHFICIPFFLFLFPICFQTAHSFAEGNPSISEHEEPLLLSVMGESSKSHEGHGNTSLDLSDSREERRTCIQCCCETKKVNGRKVPLTKTSNVNTIKLLQFISNEKKCVWKSRYCKLLF